jgi:hypothetical protein
MSERIVEGLKLLLARKEKDILALCADVGRMGSSLTYIDKLEVAITAYRDTEDDLAKEMRSLQVAAAEEPSHVR